MLFLFLKETNLKRAKTHNPLSNQGYSLALKKERKTDHLLLKASSITKM